MLSLLLTIFFSTLIIISFRVLGQLKINDFQSITINYFVAATYGFIIWQEPFSFDGFTTKPWFELSLLIGVFFILTFFLLSRSSQIAGVSITAVASRMSVVIPVIAGFALFNDRISLLKVMGIMLAIFSFYLIFKSKGEINLQWKKIILPFLLFLGIGTNDTMMKYIQHHFLAGDLTLFLTVVFSVAFVISAVIMFFRVIVHHESLSYKTLVSGFFLGSFNFGSTFYFIRGMTLFESSVFFPVVNVSIVVLTSLIGLVVFGERFSRLNWIGIFMAAAAILLITIA